MKWILRYIKGTSSVGLIYTKRNKSKCEINRYVDADYVEDLDKRRSQTDYAFTVLSNLISRKATLQHY